ncbi:ABC transporter ATP-binding protein [Leucobacter denitrificans]|uniref:ABC transporter ATP-binding protein n=1 Tax=Leucobacter denitrificans TaxID=683042 RepID=A0A7G9S2Q3_9MICO|nr:ABC transporter ATP-binding protein [Leucobacter denitrificans]QNN62128.1 ABC transporter ATP-binding protein [Leucobacter denitrificans]
MNDQPIAAIEVANLRKSYRGRPALAGLNLQLKPGQIVGLMGDNGSGKTTLLKILAGVLAEWEGEARVAGLEPGPESKALVSFLPDASFLPDSHKPADSIAQFTRFFDDFDAKKARDMVDFFGLPWDRNLKEMSKGMREKLQISLAMSRRARVYLLDEPISGVDPASRDVILRGILQNFADDALMLISTHLIQDVEPIVDSVIFLRAGQVLLQGDADELRTEHGVSLDALFRKVYAS